METTTTTTRPKGHLPRRIISGIGIGLFLMVLGAWLVVSGTMGVLDGGFVWFAGVAMFVPGCLFFNDLRRRGKLRRY